MDQLNPDSINWALTHILRFGDTDLFPIPFEYSAIAHARDEVSDELKKIDLTEYEGRPLRRFLVPKPQGGYRVAIQLDPLDTLIYTAMVYEAAEAIERQRMPSEQKIACSYRVEIDPTGQLFRKENGWPDFYMKCKELAESQDFSYVLTADIADFYNQISHHRVRNALEIAGLSPDRARNTERFLMNLTALQSKGIPVGPSASIVLSEACLSDVDMFLLRKGYTHTRYSDDIRIFCKSRSDALRSLHDLSDYLYTSHRLTLQSSKTRILTTDGFIAIDLLDPEKLEENKKTQKLNDLIEKIKSEWTNWYTDFPEAAMLEDVASQVSEKELNIARENLTELFDACITELPLNLGLARYILRRATSLQTGVLQNQVLGNLEALAPVMRDASKYLIKISRSSRSQEIGEKLTDFFDHSDVSFVPYLRLWITEIFIQKLAPKFGSSIYPLFEKTREQLGVRPIALLVRELKMLDWVREQKEVISNHGPWDKRAIIWAASVLPRDERGFWLKRVQNSGDFLDKITASAVMAGIVHTSVK